MGWQPELLEGGAPMSLKAFLTAIMSLLAIFVFLLASIEQSVLWLWIAFGCATIAGVFVQLLLQSRKGGVTRH
jgi:hypothetical protein